MSEVEIENLAEVNYENLPQDIKTKVFIHTDMGQYADGGGVNFGDGMTSESDGSPYNSIIIKAIQEWNDVADKEDEIGINSKERRIIISHFKNKNNYTIDDVLDWIANDLELDENYADGGGVGFDWNKAMKIANKLKVIKDKLADARTKGDSELVKKLEKEHEYYGSQLDAIYSNGGVVKYYTQENERLGRPSGSIEREILAKVEGRFEPNQFVGNFGWKTPQGKLADGYLYNLDDFDKSIITQVKLKDGESLFRYFNRTSAIGGMTPMIKINLNKGLIYFGVENENDDIVFETRGVNALYIGLIENKYADGGGVGKMYYHILEYGDYGNIGYQGYYDTIEEAQKQVEKLSDYFPNQTFQIFADKSRKEPPITTMADGGVAYNPVWAEMEAYSPYSSRSEYENKKEYDDLAFASKSFSKSAEILVKENLMNGEICICKLRKILGHEPAYPVQYVGSIKLTKCFLKPFYKI